ncbi:MAG: sigma-54-dependent Fis family transcriptional regulator [Deltaproteobacteria bacterium]|nr:sigma-54-dependent Fis family transcriptional regulator [Deltaproteobacteria bacterium]
MREFLEILLKRNAYQVRTADGGELGCEILTTEEFDLVITDLNMPKVGGLEVLAATKRLHPETEVVMVTAFATAETAIAAMKQGAYDYLTKPFKVDEILVTVERALEKRALVRDNVTLRAQLSDRFHLGSLVGRSSGIQQVFELIRKVAVTKTSVLIMGESGTGKELAARAIHAHSDRAEGPFVAVNCGAIPDALLESELFGHVRGAFTGATSTKEGLFATANHGTLFLDEIAELSPAMQVKLLRTLQERTIKPVGGVSELPVDVRIVAATNRNLDEEVAAGRFRSDLFYRLNVIPVCLPPLRERRADVPLLVEHFVRKFAAAQGRAIRGVTPEALSLLCSYHYPGNVRELENMIERAVTLSPGDQLDASALPELRQRPTLPAAGSPAALPEAGLDLDMHMTEIERVLVLQALDRTDGNRTEAARLLGISLRSLRYRLAKFGMEKPGAESRP